MVSYLGAELVPFLSFSPWLKWCLVAPESLQLAVTQFFLLRTASTPVPLATWPLAWNSYSPFSSLQTAWLQSTPYSHLLGWISNYVPLGGFILQSVIRGACSPSWVHPASPNNHAAFTLSSLWSPLPSSKYSTCSCGPRSTSTALLVHPRHRKGTVASCHSETTGGGQSEGRYISFP